MLKIAHFGIFRHIGGVGWVRKTYGPQNIVGQAQLYQKLRMLHLLGPHNNIFRTKIQDSKSRDTDSYVEVPFMDVEVAADENVQVSDHDNPQTFASFTSVFCLFSIFTEPLIWMVTDTST